jgi:hypothetical protein
MDSHGAEGTFGVGPLGQMPHLALFAIHSEGAIGAESSLLCAEYSHFVEDSIGAEDSLGSENTLGALGSLDLLLFDDFSLFIVELLSVFDDCAFLLDSLPVLLLSL